MRKRNRKFEPPRRLAPGVQIMRKARVLVPEEFEIPRVLDLPPLPPMLPAVHQIATRQHVSIRSTPRAHWRVYLPDRPLRAVWRTIHIPKTRRQFEPFQSHWQMTPNGIIVVNHARPLAKVDQAMNQRHRDYKHSTRQDSDDSRANAFASLSPRSPRWRMLTPALKTGDVRVAADTALVLGNL